MKLLVTCGGTEEPLDQVRSLTNISTGNTGVFLAEEFHRRGVRVHCLCAHRGKKPLPRWGISFEEFTSVDSLQEALRRNLKQEKWDGIIHSAAVSDYRIKALEQGGIRTEAQDLKKKGKLNSRQPVLLYLEPGPKLIQFLREWSCHKQIKIVGFKLTAGVSSAEKKQAVETLLGNSPCDGVLHNDLSDIDNAADLHGFTLYNKKGILIKKGSTKHAMARSLYDFMS